MLSFAVPFLFIIELGLALVLCIAWWRLSDRLQGLELRANEALDAQDLLDFQDRIAQLLKEVQEAASKIVSEIDSRRAGLEKEGSRARDTEKRLSERLKAFERLEEKARKGLEKWASDQVKRSQGSSKKKKGSKVAASKAPKNITVLAASEDLEETPRVSYLKREFRAPEPEAPSSPTASRYLKVYAFADEGKSREEIAKLCGYLPGEIDLILNLRPRSRD
jgi:hypothetical protein